MAKSRMPRVVNLGLGLALAASGVLSTASCSEEPDRQVVEDVYCTDGNGKVLPEDYCDDNDNDGHGGGFIWIGGFGGGHSPGYQLPLNQRTHDPIRYNDRTGRERAGLPGRGKVAGPGGLGGKVTTTKSGSGSSSGSKAGSSKGGGFGGGHAGGSSS
jgi:hypothetical protein